jgi:hypothetical protein
MIGASLSRWTLSYFAAAILALVAAQVLMALGFGYPSASVNAPDTLVLVHLVALGWLSLLMCGALFQFVPVLVARPLHSIAMPLPTLGILLVGIGALLLGFLQLGGHISSDIQWLPVAGILLTAGFALVLWNLGWTIWSARPLSLPARYVVLGLLSLAATVTFGAVFAFTLGGAVPHPIFFDVTAFGLPLHVVAGLVGWLTVTAMGVSYRLLAMFMLAPELDGTTRNASFYFAAAALALVVVAGTGMILIGQSPGAALLAGGALGAAALVLYGTDILRLYRSRKRRKIELNSRMAALAFASLFAAAGLSVAFVVLGQFDRRIGAVVFLLAFGWLSGLGLSKLYKIIAFLTWLECYGPILGKCTVPRVQDLVVEQRAYKWFVLYYGAVCLAELALLVDAVALFRAAAAFMAVATIGIVVQLVRTRRLADVNENVRLPAGARPPRLLVSLASQP